MVIRGQHCVSVDPPKARKTKNVAQEETPKSANGFSRTTPGRPPKPKIPEETPKICQQKTPETTPGPRNAKAAFEYLFEAQVLMLLGFGPSKARVFFGFRKRSGGAPAPRGVDVFPPGKKGVWGLEWCVLCLVVLVVCVCFELLRLTLVLKVTTDSGRHLNHTQIRTLSACRMTLLDSCSVRHFGELAKFSFFSDLPALPARPP